jgi:hypothetical protein|tara:strand:+ start:188 stop:691 length:504 start_codon:yes stop_codon:yes gene_type:complete
MDELKLIEAELMKITNFPTVGNRLRLSKLLNSKGNPARLKCIHFGIKRLGSVYSDTKATRLKLYPELEGALHSFIDSHYPDLQYNQILINKNNWFDIHKDKNNKVDNALLFCVGDFEGGKIVLHNEAKEKIVAINLKYSPILFANKTTYHSVEPWSGDRYSVITYLI